MTSLFITLFIAFYHSYVLSDLAPKENSIKKSKASCEKKRKALTVKRKIYILLMFQAEEEEGLGYHKLQVAVCNQN